MTIHIDYDDHSNEELSGWLQARDRDLVAAQERNIRLEADLQNVRDDLNYRLDDAQLRFDRVQNEFIAFKERVRSRMIEEANNRGWCSEFDAILVEFGLEPRTGNYVVRFEVEGTVELTVLARDEDHATDLAERAIRFYTDQEIEERDQTLTLYSVNVDSVERQPR